MRLKYSSLEPSPSLNFNGKKYFGGKKSLFSNLEWKHDLFSSVFAFKGARGFPGTPGLPGFKGIRVSTFFTQRVHAFRNSLDYI